MSLDVVVLGAGMVGTCTALHLRARGHRVLLLDRGEPGRETSYGNAGLIQREAVQPYAFPRERRAWMDALLERTPAVRVHWRALPRVAPRLWRYFQHASPAGHAQATRHFSALIAHALTEHQTLIERAGAQSLVKRQGFRFVFRTQAALYAAVAEAQQVADAFGVRSVVEDAAALLAAEPSLDTARLQGAVRWLDPWAVSDPGALVRHYAELLQQQGGEIARGDAATLQVQGTGWQVQTEAGPVQAQHVVVALGPWSDALVRRLGYRLPLFIKRGYHQHYSSGGVLNQPLLDAERGYVVAPMRQGWRITTGAELADLDAPATPVQLRAAEACARELLPLGAALDTPPWLGARPCIADMLPVMGAAPRHRGLWFNFAHAHQGFTLGPVAGRLVAELISGEPPLVAPAPYSPARF